MVRFSQALGLLSRCALWLAGFALLVMTVVVAWVIFGRFVLNDTPVWGEQVAMLLLGWLILAAAAAGVREGTHMGFDSLRPLLPDPLQRLCEAMSNLVITGFGAGMVFFAAELAEGVWDNPLPTTGLPAGIEYMPMVLGGVLITLFGLERLLAQATGRPLPDADTRHPVMDP